MDPTRHENSRESVDRLDDQIPDTSAGGNPSLEVDTSNNGNIDTPMTLRGTPRLVVDTSTNQKIGTMALRGNPLPDTTTNQNIDTVVNLRGNPLLEVDTSTNQKIGAIALRGTALPDTSNNQNIDTTLGGNPLASDDTSNLVIVDGSVQQTAMSRVISMPSLISNIIIYCDFKWEMGLINRINKQWRAASLKDLYRKVIVHHRAALMNLLGGSREHLKLTRSLEFFRPAKPAFTGAEVLVLLQLCPNIDTLNLSYLEPDTLSNEFVQVLILLLKTKQYNTFDNLRHITLSYPTSDIFSFFEKCPALRSMEITFPSGELLEWHPSDRRIQVAQLRTLTLWVEDGLYMPSFFDVAGHFPKLASLSILDQRVGEAPEANYFWDGVTAMEHESISHIRLQQELPLRGLESPEWEGAIEATYDFKKEKDWAIKWLNRARESGLPSLRSFEINFNVTGWSNSMGPFYNTAEQYSWMKHIHDLECHMERSLQLNIAFNEGAAPTVTAIWTHDQLFPLKIYQDLLEPNPELCDWFFGNDERLLDTLKEWLLLRRSTFAAAQPAILSELPIE